MRRAFLWLFQFAATAALLWWVFHDPAKQQALRDAVQQADWRWLVGGVAAYGVFELLAGVRWMILLRVQGIRISWGRLYGLLMVGLFFSLFIPGGTGGDLVKGYYLLKEAPVGRRTSAALSVVMDRLLGLLGIAVAHRHRHRSAMGLAHVRSAQQKLRPTRASPSSACASPA